MSSTTIAMASAPPVYSNDPHPPTYRFQPARNERRLAITPLVGEGRHVGRHLRSQSAGNIDVGLQHIDEEAYVQKNRSSGITLVLRGQSNRLRRVPRYNRRGLIDGEVILVDPENVLSVKVQVSGLMEVSKHGLLDTVPLLSHTRTLWSHDPSASVAQIPDRVQEPLGRTPCPAILPFSFRLPAIYDELDGSGNTLTFPLPPSYYVFIVARHKDTVVNGSGVHARVSYSLKITVTRKRRILKKDWTSDQSIDLILRYLPRTRPSAPLLQRPFTFRSTVKPSPDEWCQICSIMMPAEGSQAAPIDCHLVIPAEKVFALTDKIPFHVQLLAPAASLQQLYSSSSMSSVIFGKGKHRDNDSTEIDRRIVRVYLWREILMVIRGEKHWYSQEMGEGTLRSIPPPPPQEGGIGMEGALHRDSDALQTLDWEGELSVDADVETGGFRTGQLQIKDFVVVVIKVSNEQSCGFRTHRFMQAISLATEPFGGEAYGHSRA